MVGFGVSGSEPPCSSATVSVFHIKGKKLLLLNFRALNKVCNC
jgi:hypothetical protein